MRVGLVVPCYIDVFYPEIGIAALDLLEKLGVEVEYPFDQTCCGQPMANSGCESDARATEELFVRCARARSDCVGMYSHRTTGDWILVSSP